MPNYYDMSGEPAAASAQPTTGADNGPTAEETRGATTTGTTQEQEDVHRLHKYKLPPPFFTGDYSQYEEWLFKLQAYLGLIDRDFDMVLQLASTSSYKTNSRCRHQSPHTRPYTSNKSSRPLTRSTLHPHQHLPRCSSYSGQTKPLQCQYIWNYHMPLHLPELLSYYDQPQQLQVTTTKQSTPSCTRVPRTTASHYSLPQIFPCNTNYYYTNSSLHFNNHSHLQRSTTLVFEEALTSVLPSLPTTTPALTTALVSNKATESSIGLSTPIYR